ncbi:MAG: LppX_LprAFG lipoprotein [Candidatus Dormibacteria bacterium]
MPGCPWLLRLGTAMALFGALAGCGGSGPPPDPHTLLAQAKQRVDGTAALHFRLTSTDAAGSGPLITGGDGDARRPDGFTGTLQVSLDGFPTTVRIVSLGGHFFARLPFTTSFRETDPAKYGFGDPAVFLDPVHGFSALLGNAQHPAGRGRDRLSGEELDEVGCTLPGPEVAALLTSADPAQDVRATFGITADHAVRRVVLTGPFFDARRLSTYTLILDKYGENIAVTPPP